MKYEYNKRVRIINVPTSVINGKEGRLIGVSAIFSEVEFLIVELNQLHTLEGQTIGAIIMISSCLEEIA